LIAPLYCRKCGTRMTPDSLFCPACGVSQTGTDHALTNQPPKNPSLIGTGMQPAGQVLRQRYRLVQTVGRGGMGAVYAAQDTQLGDRLVAVKEMSMRRLTPQEVPQAVEQFQREAYLLASLHHPHLPAIHEYFREDERWYLVMSFIEGQTLQAVLDAAPGNRLPVSEIVRIGVELCEVLDYLHTHNPQIIFRDLKPLNIMLTPKGHICLIDFGIARHFKQDQTKDTAYYYSQGYAPPEQYGQSQTGPRSDIYSLGATLHQMASGHHPGSRPFQFSPLQLVDPTFPAPLAQLIAQMLKMEEKDRPASVAEVKVQLLTPGQVTSIGASSASPIQSTVQASTRSCPQCSEQNENSKVFCGRCGYRLQEKGSSVPPIQSTIPASASMVPAPSSFSLTARPDAIEILRTLTGHTQDVLNVTVSANGRRLASLSLDQKLKLWDVPTGQLLHTPVNKDRLVYNEEDLTLFSSVALSANGRVLEGANGAGWLTSWNAETGQFLSDGSWYDIDGLTCIALSADGQIMIGGGLDGCIRGRGMSDVRSIYHKEAVASVALSADGLTLASGSRDRTIMLWNTHTGDKLHLLKGHKEAVASVALSADGRILASGSLDGTARLWNVQKGRLFRTLKGSTKSVSLNADGLILATANYDDGTIKLWNTQTGKLLRTLTLHTGSVTSVALSADGRTLASGNSDGTVTVWGARA